MSETTSRINAVVDELQRAGRYHLRPKLLHIADVDYDFEFDAVLEGPEDEHNLIFVCYLDGSHTVAIERRLRALSIALRRTGSTRPFSLVLLMSKSDDVTVTRLQSLCRVFPVLTDGSVPVALAPLLPLPMPTQSQTLVSAVESLRKELGSQVKDGDLAADLIKAAAGDGPAVEKAVLAAIRKAATVATETQEEK
jgi:hypothetical protein